MTDLAVEAGGASLRLLPERGLLLPASATLIVADLHWGKAAAFRAASIPVPRGTTTDDLARLTGIIRRTGPRRLVVLGDLLHARAGRAPATLAAIQEWRHRHPALPITLVRGNHDRQAGDPPPALDIACCDEPLEMDGLMLCHRPAEHPASYTLAGHLHPGVVLRGPGRQRERLPCFRFGPRGAVLPAFGSFTGLAPVAPGPGDRLFVIAGSEVIEVEPADE